MLGESRTSNAPKTAVPDDFLFLLQDVMTAEQGKPSTSASRDSTNYIDLLDDMMGKLGDTAGTTSTDAKAAPADEGYSPLP